ncbi:MAG: hypothetical protein FJ104_16530 [Deltaproteobacteria bacterium]|nr:hypothetical protein [Deltaproteobacteria bacterium]
MTLTPDHARLVNLRATIERGGATVLELRGTAECERGALDGTFEGESPSQRGLSVADGRLGGAFRPKHLDAPLVAAWTATFRYKNGVTRPIAGFLGEVVAAPAGPRTDQAGGQSGSR